MARHPSRTYVFAVEFQIADTDRVLPILKSHQDSVVDLGARYAFVYESTVEHAMRWIQRSDVASTWLPAAQVGVYPPVFVGRFVNAMRLSEATGVGLY